MGLAQARDFHGMHLYPSTTGSNMSRGNRSSSPSWDKVQGERPETTGLLYALLSWHLKGERWMGRSSTQDYTFVPRSSSSMCMCMML
jgi:hypothetical protein